MKKRIDERLPKEIGEGVFPNHAAIASPWGKLVSFQEAAHYAARYSAVISAAIMQAYRILVPDYVERSKALCANAYKRLYGPFSSPYAKTAMNEHNIHPFCRGNFVGALNGDAGDDALLMCGRVNDFGTYRAEKELDVCPWDIIGSELCRATTQSLQGVADGEALYLQSGPKIEYHMVEAKGCGDLHCRIVAESREKFPMPPHEQWECFGPVATADQIKFTPEEECLTESMMFRQECDYKFVNGTCWERDYSSAYPMIAQSNGATYILPTIDDHIADGTLNENLVDHVIKCVCETAGKAAFGEFYAKKGLCDWLGVPKNIDDGRIMGGHIEMFLQSMRIDYTVEAFCKEEVVYIIDRAGLANRMQKWVDALVAFWYGATKTLVNAQWSLWEDAAGVSEDKLRIKIAKKIDKFC